MCLLRCNECVGSFVFRSALSLSNGRKQKRCARLRQNISIDQRLCLFPITLFSHFGTGVKIGA